MEQRRRILLAWSLLRAYDVDTRRRLRSADSHAGGTDHNVRRSATVSFLWLRHMRGTACHRLSGMSFRRELKTVLFGRRLTIMMGRS